MTTCQAVTPEAFAGLVRRNRSCRRFRPEVRLTRDELAALVDVARLSASGGNNQPLRYRLVWEAEACARVFPHTRWAGRLGGWQPAESERPVAYIVVLAAPNAGTMAQVDAGIAMQTLLLAATARGMAGCMLGAIDRPAIRAALALPEELELLYVIGLGTPAECFCLEEARGGQVAYTRDAEGVHHVPKRPLADVLV